MISRYDKVAKGGFSTTTNQTQSETRVVARVVHSGCVTVSVTVTVSECDCVCVTVSVSVSQCLPVILLINHSQ